jgi:hypothetical protein
VQGQEGALVGRVQRLLSGARSGAWSGARSGRSKGWEGSRFLSGARYQERARVGKVQGSCRVQGQEGARVGKV